MEGDIASQSGTEVQRPKRRGNRRRWRVNWPVAWLAAGLVAWWAGYVAGLPLLARTVPGLFTARQLRELAGGMDWPILLISRTAEFMVAGWFFVLGAVIGSFLNVVAARWPRGEGFVARDSHCPVCHGPILSRDNVPILGWLLLRGRCRNCRLPIPHRYWMVEALTGAIFWWIAQRQLLSGGANLPGWSALAQAGAHGVVFDPKWNLIGLYAWHVTLFSLLIVVALIAADQLPLPRGMWVAGLVAGFVPPLVFPFLQQPGGWPILSRDAAQSAGTTWLTLLTSLTGASSGLLIAMASLGPVRWEGRPAAGVWCLAWCLTGLFLGWQAALSIALITAVAVALTGNVPRLQSGGPVFGMLLAAAVHHGFWKWLLWGQQVARIFAD